MGKIKFAFIVMVLITIVAGIVVAYAVATNDEEEIHRFCFEYIKAVPLDEEPAYYNGDNASFCPCVIEALENPGTWVETEMWLLNKTAEDWWIYDGIGYTYPGDYVKYAGYFYMIDQEWHEPPLRWFLSDEIINQTPKMVGGTAVGWAAFGAVVVYVKRKSATTKSLETVN